MEASIITKGRYKYVRDVKIGPPEAIDVHHLFIAKSGADCLSLCSYALRFAAAFVLIFLLLQKTTSVYDLLMLDKPAAIVLWSFVLAGFIVRQLLRKQVEKESVIIFPAFGVQLETVYRSGKTVHQFVPIDKILKPVLYECVTPVTCYWSLSLILRGEDELLLVFKGLYPPVTMLIPIWKALCAAIDNKEWADMPLDCDT
ncbi:phosphatidylinositolglycan-like protein [Perilla frutescens var. hirtella]|uniref:Phosphatidylinositolglycan-like protein n=1 Tax=Perilla frutescens var. hirtella TaxID=608512 RepID=A0AAD4PC71_PERFH|nr:phosphatidylinositolglycan-like protein [Perilla frutescens var. hirtella]